MYYYFIRQGKRSSGVRVNDFQAEEEKEEEGVSWKWGTPSFVGIIYSDTDFDYTKGGDGELPKRDYFLEIDDRLHQPSLLLFILSSFK